MESVFVTISCKSHGVVPLIFKNLTFQIFIGALLGVAVGLLFGDGALANPDSDAYQIILLLKSAFLSALKMLIAPMIFFSLIGGIISIGDVIKLREIGGITVLYYFSTTLIAIVLGLIAIFFIHPWTMYPAIVEIQTAIPESRMIDPGSDSIVLVLSQILSLALTNPVSALVNLNIIGIVTNAILIGLAMVLALPKQSSLFGFIDQVNAVIIQVLQWVLKFLPIGIFAIIVDFTIKLGVGEGNSADFLTQLLQFSMLVISLTLFHGMVVLPLIAWFFGDKSPVKLLKQISRPLIVAFSTSSSAATLPVSMRTCDEELGIDSSVSSFVLPLGATMNMDGTALFEAVAAVFLAYLYGIELTTIMIFSVFLMSMVSSIGAPGMPSASMAGMQMVLLAVGIPLEAIAILLVIERPLDTVRTAVNVEGDIIGALIVNKYRGNSPARQ